MKTKINRNYFWCEKFVEELSASGVKYACISPGSRSTSLTIAFARNKSFNCIVNIDERSSAFMALGIAEKTNVPVVLVCTSGTAAAEFYPAIVEAYQQRIPLIVCTADRPPYLYNTGANQTINQIDLYKNHIRWFADAGLPDMSKEGLLKIINYANHAVNVSLLLNKGPVHINFPFEKPFEPAAYTDEIDNELLGISFRDSNPAGIKPRVKLGGLPEFKSLYKQLKNTEKGIIIAGPDSYNRERIEGIIALSERLNYPLIADALSQIRFSSAEGKNILCNYEEIFRNGNFTDDHKPDIIIQLGRAPISKTLERYFEKNDLNRILINKYGDRFDPSRKVKTIFPWASYDFCGEMLYQLDGENFLRKNSSWTKEFRDAEVKVESTKKSAIYGASFPDETRIINEVLKSLPKNSSVFISNSLPVRDMDKFTSRLPKDIKIFFNRGASGIDGIISTAAGICIAENRPLYLITGDLAFYYDMNVMPLIKRMNLPLSIILINNNGGAIFSTLPVASNGKSSFETFFLTPHDLNFENIVKGYGVNYLNITSWDDLSGGITDDKITGPKVLEIKTDYKASALTRKLYSEAITASFISK